MNILRTTRKLCDPASQHFGLYRIIKKCLKNEWTGYSPSSFCRLEDNPVICQHRCQVFLPPYTQFLSPFRQTLCPPVLYYVYSVNPFYDTSTMDSSYLKIDIVN